MRTIFLLISTTSVLACEDKKISTTATAAPVAQAALSGAPKEAADIFNTRCATCHGAAGKGDGAAAQALNPKPRDMTDTAWQKSVGDDHLRKIIVEGGPAVGKSPLMPPNPDLKDKAEVVGELVKHVRSLGR